MFVLLIGIFGYFVSAANPGHSADYIWIVDKNGDHVTLQNAIDLNNLGDSIAGNVELTSCSVHAVEINSSNTGYHEPWDESGGLAETTVCQDAGKVLVGISTYTVSNNGVGTGCDGSESVPGDCGEIYTSKVRCCIPQLV